jgi:hypothetical protein
MEEGYMGGPSDPCKHGVNRRETGYYYFILSKYNINYSQQPILTKFD